MIQADRELLERARATARQRGISFPAFVRDALERELRSDAQPPLSCIGAISTGGDARGRPYEPDPWR
jgi:hypothetical protein